MITFNSTTILDDPDEGDVAEFARGIRQKNTVLEQLPRSNGELVKHLGNTGCDHSFRIVFYDRTTAQATSIISRMETLALNTNVGNLAYTKQSFSVGNCYVMSVELIRNDLRTKIEGENSYSDLRELEYAITFRQLI